MQFLWGLLPGAREARNDLAVGYAWIFAVALFVTIPDASDASHVGRLIAAVGPVGVGVAVSFIAALVGSMLTEAAREVFDVAATRSILEHEEPEDLARPMPGPNREEAVRLTGERERVEATADRLAAEFLLRVLLLPPLCAGIVAAVIDGELWWLGAAVGAAAGLAVQAIRRREDLRREQKASGALRARIKELAPGV